MYLHIIRVNIWLLNILRKVWNTKENNRPLNSVKNFASNIPATTIWVSAIPLFNIIVMILFVMVKLLKLSHFQGEFHFWWLIMTLKLRSDSDQCGRKNCDMDQKYGMHENSLYFRSCIKRYRNKNLFISTQNLKGHSARYTRQNNNGKVFFNFLLQIWLISS